MTKFGLSDSALIDLHQTQLLGVPSTLFLEQNNSYGSYLVILRRELAFAGFEPKTSRLLA